MSKGKNEELVLPWFVRISGPETSLRLRCNAACVRKDGGRDDELLLLSVAGPETSIKALNAVLHQKGGKTELKFIEEPSGFYAYRTVAHPDGYRIQRAEIAPGIWHALAIAKAPGFMPALSEESLWQKLRSDEFTTPLLRSWLPWIQEQLTAHNGLARLSQAGCNCGLLRVGDEWLDEVVALGVRKGQLKLEGE